MSATAPTLDSSAADLDILRNLNRNYIRSVQESDVRWFDEHLSDPVQRGDGVVYWNPVKGTTVDTPFAKVLAKSRFKPTTTNRNLRTLTKLLD